MYDPEATIQDADILMMQYADEARALEAARRRGNCTHQSTVGYRVPAIYPEQEGLNPGESRCTDGCERVFFSDEDWVQAMEEALYL